VSFPNTAYKFDKLLSGFMSACEQMRRPRLPIMELLHSFDFQSSRLSGNTFEIIFSVNGCIKPLVFVESLKKHLAEASCTCLTFSP